MPSTGNFNCNSASGCQVLMIFNKPTIIIGRGLNFVELLEHKKQLSTTKLCLLLLEKGYQPKYHVTSTICDRFPAHFC